MSDAENIQVKLGPLKLTYLGDCSEDFLSMIIECSGVGSYVRFTDSCVRVQDLEAWVEACEPLYETISGCASLSSIENKIEVHIKMLKTGSVELEIQVTPDNLNQQHKYACEADQTDLGLFISGCKKLLRER